MTTRKNELILGVPNYPDPPKMPDQVLSESRIQAECVKWYRNTYCLKHHSPRCMILSIPNEGRGAASAQLIATGLYPGAGDVLVFHLFKMRGPRTIFFEFKREDGIQSQKQKEFQAHCMDMGIAYHVIRSLPEFQRVIESL